MPEFLKMGLEAEQGMVGTPSPFLGIVADLGKLGFAIESQDYGIQVEDETGSGLGESKEYGSKLIVQSHQLADGLGGKSFEKAAQSRLIGEFRESQQREEGSVVLQDLGLVDSSQASDDHIKES